MALTKIQPSGLDATKDYSVNKITVSGVDVLGYAQSAFLQANTVYNTANTLSPTDAFARDTANAAYTQANTATTNALAASTYANASFSVANTAYGWGNHASVGYATTGYVTTEISNLINNAPSALDTLNELAVALGNDANFSTTITNMVGTTGTYANAAFIKANTATTNALAASTYANAAFSSANTNATNISTNATNITAAGNYANSAFVQANAAFAKANTGGASGLIYKASATTPATANIGDQWYSTTEDVLYEYLSDGTSNAWVDITSSAITTNAGSSGSSGGSGTNNARSIINSYIFGY